MNIKTSSLLLGGIMTLGLISGTVSAAGDAAAGKAKSAVCMACHGPDGNSPNNPLWPKLAGQHSEYLKKQMVEFKAQTRKEAMMLPMMLPLSEEDMDNLAAYFSSQPMKGGKGKKELVALGEEIYRAGNSKTGVTACLACHGPSGNGNSVAKFPSINGQHAAYAEKQLKAFRAGERNNDMNKMMQNVASNMSDEEIKAVASYIEGLR